LSNLTDAELNNVDRLEARLRGILYRFDCPAPQTLGEYRLGLVMASERADIERHLALCPHCRAELATLDQFLHDFSLDVEQKPAPESGIGKAARTVIARLVEWGQGQAGGIALPGLQPAYAGLRGEGGLPRRYVAETISINLSVEPDPEAADRRLLLGLVAPHEGELAAWEGTPVVLQQGGQTVMATQVDDLSNFALSGVAPGAYTLTLQGDPTIVLETVEVA
jgi:hypothetical protein